MPHSKKGQAVEAYKMADSLQRWIRLCIKSELQEGLAPHLSSLETGDYAALFSHKLAQLLLGHADTSQTSEISPAYYKNWNDFIFRRLEIIFSDRSLEGKSVEESPLFKQYFFFIVAVASLQSFIQANVTGPPLPFDPAVQLLPQAVSANSSEIKSFRARLIEGLGIDGEAAYRLTPFPELLCLADTILTCPPLSKNIPSWPWARLRVTFIHQRILSERSAALQKSIFSLLKDSLNTVFTEGSLKTDSEAYAEFLLERAAINLHHGFDQKAREDIDEVSKLRGFEFALTGLLGKRTKFQDFDISQLVVLARSREDKAAETQTTEKQTEEQPQKPQNLDLNDDTLLEAISFSEKPKSSADFKDEHALPESLASLDPSTQPLLDPLDSVTLLSLASSITNTSPSDGLTREQTLPYATRVLDGGSSNWQVYTQALLVRSRIEGYRSRTIERGLLQLQAVVDQVIADTTPDVGSSTADTITETHSTTFLPRAKDSESAPAAQRLRYVHALSSPYRWDLEAELASRWVSLGGLRTALEIYERLEMWAEAALCWAATEREDKAKAIVRRQLFERTGTDDDDPSSFSGPALAPAPAEAPRLYCILGDIDSDPAMWEAAWEISHRRYARAQRSLGRHYYRAGDQSRAAAAYAKALAVNKLHHGSWFALGCALLALGRYPRAADAFARCVQLDDTDGEAWSNLAAALLRQGATQEDDTIADPDADASSDPAPDHRREALRALRRAAALKHDDARVWENVLTVAAAQVPPAYSDVAAAMRRVIELRGGSVGEQCIDERVLGLLVRDVVLGSAYDEDAARRGLVRLTLELLDKQVVPLITASAALWELVARVALWRRRPGAALESREKAWRAVVGQPGWESGSEEGWERVVEATVALVSAYEQLGPMERTEGLAAGSGQVVAKDWKFKARSAVKGILGRGRELFEGSGGWKTLEDVLGGLS